MRYQPVTTAAMFLATLALSAGFVHAQTTAVGPYYATPSWDQKIACTSLSNCPRFIVLSNWNGEAVLDRETGLVWDRSPDRTSLHGWSSAFGACHGLEKGNRFGWRLPTIEELSTLIDRTQSLPSLPAGHPFDVRQFAGTQVISYWSATSQSEDDLTVATTINFFGSLSSEPRLFEVVLTESSLAFVWCVRGGQIAHR